MNNKNTRKTTKEIRGKKLKNTRKKHKEIQVFKINWTSRVENMKITADKMT